MDEYEKVMNEFRFGKGHDPKTCHICKELGIPYSRPTQYALDAAMPPSAEVDSSLDIIPAGEVDTQPRQ